ncbi:hypothetical protein [Gilliamella apicola]|uniref:hypothetical protein n=1 Tax=Gilliamella apicola TaxID=1196095 RepID=UPI002FEE00C4
MIKKTLRLIIVIIDLLNVASSWIEHSYAINRITCFYLPPFLSFQSESNLLDTLATAI